MADLSVLNVIRHRIYSQESINEILNMTDKDIAEFVKEILDIDYKLECFFRRTELDQLSEKYPELKSFAYEKLDVEGWKVTDSVRKVLERIKNFIQRIMNYVGSFASMRINAARNVTEKYLSALQDRGNVVKLTKYAQKEDMQLFTVQAVVDVLNASQKLYVDYCKKLEQVRTMSPEKANVDGDINAIIGVPESKKVFDEKVKILRSQSPGNGETQTASTTPENGGWFDPGKINQLNTSIKNSITTLQNLKAVKASCDQMIVDLSKTDSNTEQKQTDNDTTRIATEQVGGSNKAKLKFLRDFSKSALTAVIGEIVKASSAAASRCNGFLGKIQMKEEE